jgi:condensin complex subunit 3
VLTYTHCTAADEKNTQEDEDDESTTASRFTARLLRFLLKGFLAKDKSIRYRVLQTVAEMVSHLGEIEYNSNLVFLLQFH